MLERNVEKLLFLPLYPQYSAACSASSFDALSKVFQALRAMPELRTVMQYHDHPLYIEALKRSVLEHWEKNGRAEKLLLSFHGIPKRYSEAGDPYQVHCKKTAGLLAEALLLDAEAYAVAFQSRFGREEWLKPYTDETLLTWAKAGVSSVEVLCPGFAADCLETLEEIDEQNRELFLGAGGKKFAYIPALNDRDDFIQALAAICSENLRGWVDFAAKDK
jgi:ferrochelatase